jgi:hypothetical protein
MALPSRVPQVVRGIVLAGCAWAGLAYAQAPTGDCVQPLCVNRADDNAASPVAGMLRDAVRRAPRGAVITFDPALDGQTITLEAGPPNHHIHIEQDLTIQGPGANLLTISGGGATRIFFIAGGMVRISGLTLADGLAVGGAGGGASGGAGGGGGAAGLGGAILVAGGSLALNGVVLRGNRAVGGAGGPGGVASGISHGGGGGGLAGPGSDAPEGRGGAGVDLPPPPGSRAGVGGDGGRGEITGAAGGDGGWGAGGGGGGFHVSPDAARGGAGGKSGFGGGAGGAGGFSDSDGNFFAGRGGLGGAGLGGAIFVSSGVLELSHTVFENNSSVGGTAGDQTGPAKGGALAVCTSALCDLGYDAVAISDGETVFRGNSAADAGGDETCPGRDDADVCGNLSSPAPTRFRISAPESVISGEQFSFTVTALDTGNNLVRAYSGTVRISSSDPSSKLPADAPLTKGAGIFSITLTTEGSHTITALDTSANSIAGTSSPVVVKNGEIPEYGLKATLP